MKSRLVILSDLWGFDNASWIKNYTESLEPNFELIYYDSAKLAGIDKIDLSEEELHLQFLNYGIQNAVDQLLKLEPKEIIVLAFSIGGTIAWKAAHLGLKINHFYAISSTRLRYEVKKPKCSIRLMFAENDLFIPEHNWFNTLDIEPSIIENEVHEMYKNEEISTLLCNQIIIENTLL